MFPGDAEHRGGLILAWADRGDKPLLAKCAPSLPARVSFPHAGTGCAGSTAGLKELSAAFEVLCFFFLPHLPKALLDGGWGLRPGQEIRDYG